MNDTDIIYTSNPPLYASHHLIFSVTMDGTINGTTITDILETVQKNRDIVPKQLAAHGITIPHVRSDYYLVAQKCKVN